MSSMLNNDTANDVKPTVSRGARACTVCRSAKMKCVGAEDDGAKPCQRCRRSNVECIFEKHRRGRKPGSKLSEASKMLRKLEKGVSAQKSHPSLDIPPPQTPFPVSDSRSVPAFHSRYSPRDVYARPHAHSPYTTPAAAHPFPPFHPPSDRYSHRPSPSPAPMDADIDNNDNDNEDEDEEDKDVDDTMYPAPMVEREGRRQSFFGTVLTRDDSSKPPPSQKTQSPIQQIPPPTPSIPPRQAAQRDPAPTSAPRGPLGDVTNLMDDADVGRLFEMFFVRLNPFINLFDPVLHTPAYVRTRCPLLYATLLMVGSKFWAPDRFRACQRVAEDLCVRAFSECWKRVEVVQAFMCMTYWKDPDDSRTWTYIGYACRMAVELGLNAYTPEAPAGETALQRLERRNRERTYLVLWVHDRSLSMQTGRMWMLPEDDIVRFSTTWHIASPLSPIDTVVAAQVQLRYIAAEVTDVFFLHKARAVHTHAHVSASTGVGGQGSVYAPADVNYEILLRGCNRKLEAWEEDWVDSVRKAGGERFHFSLLLFFKLHVRLFLNSFGLQSSLLLTAAGGAARRAPSLPALSMCYESAVHTLKLVGEEFAKVDMLRYGQDSITVMTAYSAVFLLKLLRSSIAGPEIGDGAQDQVYALINAAADAYQDAAKTMSVSLEYHGRFLRTLVVKDRALRQRQSERERRAAVEGHGHGHGGQMQQQQHDRHHDRRDQLNGLHGGAGAGTTGHDMSPKTGHAMGSTLARSSPPNSASISYTRSGAGGVTNGAVGNSSSTGSGSNGIGSQNTSNTSNTNSAASTTSNPRPPLVTSSLYQPRPTHATTPQATYTSYAWHFPASPHLPAHPLVSPDGEMGVDVQMQGWGQGASGVVAGGGGGAGGGATGASAAAAAAAALEQLADGEAAPNMKMELAYWYNMHSEMGYGHGAPPIYMTTPYRALDQMQQSYGHTGTLSAG